MFYFFLAVYIFFVIGVSFFSSMQLLIFFIGISCLIHLLIYCDYFIEKWTYFLVERGIFFCLLVMDVCGVRRGLLVVRRFCIKLGMISYIFWDFALEIYCKILICVVILACLIEVSYFIEDVIKFYETFSTIEGRERLLELISFFSWVFRLIDYLLCKHKENTSVKTLLSQRENPL